MSNGNKYILTIKKTVMQRKGSEVISVLQNGSKVTGEVFIDNDPVMNRLTVYLDTKNKEDAIGMVEAQKENMLVKQWQLLKRVLNDICQ